MERFFIIAASKDHVLKGVQRSFAQAGHGKKDFISKPSKGDWVVFYSSKDSLTNNKPLQKFTAIGEVADDIVFQAKEEGNFYPYRRKVNFIACKETEIKPLLPHLTFIKNKTNWGFYLMSGFKEISKEDFEVIKKAMAV